MNWAQLRFKNLFSASVVMAAMLLLASVLTYVYSVPRVPQMLPDSLRFAAVSLAALLTLGFLKNYRHIERLAPLIFFFLALSALIFGYANTQLFLENQLYFQPFIAIKILCFLCAFILPIGHWTGWMTFFMSLGFLFYQYYEVPPELRLIYGVQEPGITIIVIISAAAVYLSRIQMIQAIRKEGAIELQKETFRKFSHLTLGIQHLLATPLQTIDAVVRVGRKSNPESREILDTIERSLIVISKVNQLLAQTEKRVQWIDLKLPESFEDFDRDLNDLLRLIKS